MAITHEFEYFKPRDLTEAVGLMTRYGRGARVLAGGTDLIGWLRDGVAIPDAIIDIKGLSGCDAIEERNGKVRIGALATFNQIVESPLVRERLPLLAEAAAKVGNYGLRNRATMTGNICSAVPCCDSGPPLLVYDAEISVLGRAGERIIPIGEWFTGPKQNALGESEIALAIGVPIPALKQGACYVKLGRYQGHDLAQAGVAVVAYENRSYRVAFGAVAATPRRSMKIEEALAGRILDEALMQQAKTLALKEISPITDIRATKEYRSHMIGVMLGRALQTAVARLAGQGPDYGADVI